MLKKYLKNTKKIYKENAENILKKLLWKIEKKNEKIY